MDIAEMYATSEAWIDMKDTLENQLIRKWNVASPFLGSAYDFTLVSVTSDGLAKFINSDFDSFYFPVRALLDPDPNATSWKNWCEAEIARRELAAYEARERSKAEREEAERRMLDEILRRHPEWLDR